MTAMLRVILEMGKKRRVVAGAVDWPGLDRWGTSENDALDKLSSYLPRYAGVAGRAGMGSAFARARGAAVVERVPGSSSTDFWGIAHVPSQIEREVLAPVDLERRLDLVCACRAYFDDMAARISPELRPGPRTVGAVATRSSATRTAPSRSSSRARSRSARRSRTSLPRTAWRRIGRNSSMPFAPTTPKAGRRGPGRSSSWCAAPPNTSWIMRGSWRTGTSDPEDADLASLHASRVAGRRSPWRGRPRAGAAGPVHLGEIGERRVDPRRRVAAAAESRGQLRAPREPFAPNRRPARVCRAHGA